MIWRRASGILLHPTSLPGRFGIGDLGPGAERLLDFLVEAGQRIWQVLPLGPTGYGNSPYAMLSAFAGNPLLISPELLLHDGLLTEGDLAHVPTFPTERADYSHVVPWKLALLDAAHARFVATGTLRAEFAAFCAAERDWLDDYALFAALKAAHGGVAWVEWPAPYARREAAALAEARARLAEAIEAHQFAQFHFFRQWERLRQAAQQRGITVVGDLAIFVAHDSADVWAHPDLFQLDSAGMPTVVAGVPPDYFSPTGQRWGNPLYRWDVLARQGYSWWVARVRQALRLHDVLRLDHFRGFAAAWQVPADAPTAEGGAWVPGPGMALFSAIREALGEVPLLAEDLGVITPDVTALRRALGYPGMRILQFGFGGDAHSRDLPHNYSRRSVVYTGTHDNDTTRGWFAVRSEAERAAILRYLNCAPADVVWAMLRAASASVARQAIFPLQDVLELGSEARMNFPSHADGNWEWRCTVPQLTADRAARLADLTRTYGR